MKNEDRLQLIQADEIIKILNLAIEITKSRFTNVSLVNENFYWCIDVDEKFDMSNGSPEILVGSIKDDMDFLFEHNLSIASPSIYLDKISSLLSHMAWQLESKANS